MPDARLRFDKESVFHTKSEKKILAFNSISYSNTNQFFTVNQIRYANSGKIEQENYNDNLASNRVRIALVSNWQYNMKVA